MAVAVPIAVAILLGAWASKESASDHAADIAAIRALQQRTLDVVCIDHPSERPCRQVLP